MRITQRQVVLALLGLLVAITFIVLIIQIGAGATGSIMVANVVGLLMFSVLLAAYWRGWEYARHATVILITLLISIATPEPYLTDRFTQAAFIPPVLALILVSPLWVLGSATSLVVMLAVRAGGRGIYTDPMALAIYALVVGGIILARLVTETAQREAEAQMQRAEEALAQSEVRAAEVAHKVAELGRQNDEQRRLIDLVATLETPAVALAEGVLLAPVVGHLDSRRAQMLTERLLQEVGEARARLVVLDIAGVSTVDKGVAHALLRAVQAVRLLGCDVTITGISASIATTMTQLDISLTGVRTARTPQEALQQAVVAGSPSEARQN
ncbi:MAG: STAS domain-containing protein [Chloroflexales bacterium]|nr:STAS domain-containing protein [Chloroflexales bacterium]